jgi:hypothetical protein
VRPGLFTLSVQRGASLCLDLPIRNDDGTAWDLTGYQAKLRVYDKERTVVLSLDATEGTPTPQLTVHASKAVFIDGEMVTTGVVELDLNTSTTDQLGQDESQAMANNSGPLRYQLDIVEGGTDKTTRTHVGEVMVYNGRLA